jgi:membrane-bound metal-dependent hydrolase YbcI (DUF457 family)
VDNLTHSLFAATLGRTPLGRAGRGTTATLILASNAPDVDIVATAGGSLKYLEWHRGMTHGPLGLIGLAIVVAAIVETARRMNPRWRHPGEDAPFPMLIAVAGIGILFHVLMDLPTSYGTRMLSPFSWRWYALDWMPIVDIYMWIALGSGLFLGRLSQEARRRNATIVLTFVAAIYGVRGFMHHEALDLAPRLFGAALPPRCDPPPEVPQLLDSWPRPVPSPPQAPTRRCLVEIAALPTFMSPFDWRIVAHMSSSYEIHEVNLLDGRLRQPDSETNVFWRQTLRYPNIWTPEAHRAAATRTGQVFLGFSRFPSARIAHDSNGAAIVRFSDVRFAGGRTLTDQPVRRVQPFTITIRFDVDGNVIAENLGQ